jgi:hypothetical protein
LLLLLQIQNMSLLQNILAAAGARILHCRYCCCRHNLQLLQKNRTSPCPAALSSPSLFHPLLSHTLSDPLLVDFLAASTLSQAAVAASSSAALAIPDDLWVRLLQQLALAGSQLRSQVQHPGCKLEL